MSKSDAIEVCSFVGSTSMLLRKPDVARLSDVVVVMIKSGIALWLGKSMPSPPLIVWMCPMYLEMMGMLVVPSRSW